MAGHHIRAAHTVGRRTVVVPGKGCRGSADPAVARVVAATGAVGAMTAVAPSRAAVALLALPAAAGPQVVPTAAANAAVPGRCCSRRPIRRRLLHRPDAPAGARRVPIPVVTLLSSPNTTAPDARALPSRKVPAGSAGHDPKTIVPASDRLVPRHAGSR